MAYKVFISFKNLDDATKQPTRDSEIAAALYNELKWYDIEAFFSNEEVQRKARPDYGDLIDEALESSQVLLLVGTRAEYVNAQWVVYEWRGFNNEIHSGRKNGQIITVLEGMSVSELPFALRSWQAYSSGRVDIAKAAEMAAGVLKRLVGGAANPAQSESAETMHIWGDDYYYGRNGKSQDYAEAVRWYRKAAEQGYAAAQNNLGNCYRHGRGVAQDYAEAVRLYRKAVEQGNAAAQNNLGYCYHNGKGVAQDYAEAVRWFKKAAEQGQVNAQYNLGVYYRDGKGIKRDIAEARRLFKLAADQGNEDAKKALKEL